MANARIDRKGFLKSLGVAAAACAGRPASALAARVEPTNFPATPALALPRKTRAAARIVAFRAPSF